MKNKLNQILKTGYGLGLLSFDRAKRIAGQVKRDLHLDDNESLRLAKELVTSSEKATRDVLRMVDKNLSKALIRSKLVKKRELFRAKRKLRKVLRKSMKKR